MPKYFFLQRLVLLCKLELKHTILCAAHAYVCWLCGLRAGIYMRLFYGADLLLTKKLLHRVAFILKNTFLDRNIFQLNIRFCCVYSLYVY